MEKRKLLRDFAMAFQYLKGIEKEKVFIKAGRTR